MQELLNDPYMNNYPVFRTFCELKSLVLRKQALAALTPFLKTVETWSFEQRQEFVSWLYTHDESSERSDSYNVFVYSLVTNVLRPTLFEWKQRFLNDPRPHRWLQEYEQAFALGGVTEQIAVQALMDKKIHALWFAFHHINEDLYLGEVDEDRGIIMEARQLNQSVLSEEKQVEYEAELSYYSDLLADWVTYTQTESKDESFLDWCERNERNYPFTESYYYEE
ncbi:hypothetical protein [Exiguobacterium aurantiacum]|uniref:Uncharacterized protein n=1 Tax=Exiguobacterium aurantiacum TaxID=33987 RepID=A0A377FTH9_9BACL|nr:hypothetical protein [Exiguobacterium aurantiacum]STO08129.1 Uncharacterised protein [Exiguobacterium aurantiacum]